MLDHLKLAAAALSPALQPGAAEQAPRACIIGQERAQQALEFAVRMTAPGYNVFVMGEPGSGRLTLVNEFLNQYAAEQSAPNCYAYVDHFDNPREPMLLSLPAGQGQIVNKDLEKLLEEVLGLFPAVFENPSYVQKKTAIERRFNQQYQQALELVDNKARAQGLVLYRDNDSISFLPVRDNQVLDDAQYALLPDDERELLRQQTEALEEYLGDLLLELPQWRRTLAEDVRQLDHDTISHALEPLINELRERYRHIDDVLTYLDALEINLRQTISQFLMPNRTSDTPESPARRQWLIDLYLPNILVDADPLNDNAGGAPVIYEAHPTYANLFGRIEYLNEQGTLNTHFRRIWPGALHKANGGYLVLDAEKLLGYAHVWDSLKRALKNARIEIESPQQDASFNAATLKPEVVPLNLKVILIGSRLSYSLLQSLDSEFDELFRVLADFDEVIPLSADTVQQFNRRMQHHAASIGNAKLSDAALQRLLEQACRWAEDQQRLSAHVHQCLDIVSEAHCLMDDESKAIDQADIERALDARQRRNGALAKAILDDIVDGTILIDTDGAAVGQINGLTVIEHGNCSFGVPARITATVHPGSRGIVDIEGEVELGQAIHSKGVLILTGYLGHHYAQNFALSISANIAMEQSYGEIDGDSASLAELCCLISALTRLPIQQNIAVTGSINQHGEVQAIGGVNEKIEGFFDLCAARGLTGRQAVIIPEANKRHLVLNQTVRQAVAENRFAIYAVKHVDQALSLLLNRATAARDEQGQYPEDSLNQLIINRLKSLSNIGEENSES
jgi:predicted ATP-dependent protease